MLFITRALGLELIITDHHEPDAALALPTAKIAVMGPEPAINAVFFNKIQAIEDPEERERFIAEKRAEYEKDIDILHLASENIVDAVVQPEGPQRLVGTGGGRFIDRVDDVDAGVPLQQVLHGGAAALLGALGDVVADDPRIVLVADPRRVLQIDAEALDKALVPGDVDRNLAGIEVQQGDPGVGRLFAHNRRETQETDIVLTLTPHIVRVLELSEDDLRPFRVGRGVGTLGLSIDLPAAVEPQPEPPAAPQRSIRPRRCVNDRNQSGSFSQSLKALAKVSDLANRSNRVAQLIVAQNVRGLFSDGVVAKDRAPHLGYSVSISPMVM